MRLRAVSSSAAAISAAAAGAPLVAIGALTRRFAGQVVLAPDAPVRERSLAALFAGGWRGVRFGLQTGADGTEQAMRLLLVAARANERPRTCDSGGLVAADPLRGEPRWIGFGTSEALVAALQDGRVAAFLGRSIAAAQATSAGGSEIVANLSTGDAGADATAALVNVLVARRDHAGEREPARQEWLEQLVRACAAAAASLAGPAGVEMITRAMPDRDPIHLGVALRLDHPSPAASAYALDGRLSTHALASYLELARRAGQSYALEPSALVSERFSP
jgi:ABC-type nitrate/sulfonate/bicarbonate transport system substrate-binding protein